MPLLAAPSARVSSHLLLSQALKYSPFQSSHTSRDCLHLFLSLQLACGQTPGQSQRETFFEFPSPLSSLVLRHPFVSPLRLLQEFPPDSSQVYSREGLAWTFTLEFKAGRAQRVYSRSFKQGNKVKVPLRKFAQSPSTNRLSAGFIFLYSPEQQELVDAIKWAKCPEMPAFRGKCLIHSLNKCVSLTWQAQCQVIMVLAESKASPGPTLMKHPIWQEGWHLSDSHR